MSFSIKFTLAISIIKWDWALKKCLLLSPISLYHSLLAHEAGRWSKCKQQTTQRYGATEKRNFFWLSADHPNNAKFKEICRYASIHRYPRSINLQQQFQIEMSDESYMNMTMSTTNAVKRISWLLKTSPKGIEIWSKVKCIITKFCAEGIYLLPRWG